MRVVGPKRRVGEQLPRAIATLIDKRRGDDAAHGLVE